MRWLRPATVGWVWAAIHRSDGRWRTARGGRPRPLAWLAFLVLGVSAVWAQPFRPDLVVRPDRLNVLPAVNGQLSEGLLPLQPEDHRKFPVRGWKQAGQAISWDVTVVSGDDYGANVLLEHASPESLLVELTAGNSSARVSSKYAPNHRWKRLLLNGTLWLPAGKHKLTLRIRPDSGGKEFTASVFSVELVRPAVRYRLREAAQKMRGEADTTWFREARYGLMVHWTSTVFPRTGERKPYAQAVRDFDVRTFVDQVAQTGAGFVTLTTSHAEHYFPAPIQAVDAVLPGRTAERDLVADLIKALEPHQIRLMLYYHLGASSDPAWLKASGFWETDSGKFFRSWTNMVVEIGERYGRRLAGWWFDDGTMNYYYRSPDWEQLLRAAGAGNPRRLVTFNPWVLPLPSDFMNYHAGEGNLDPAMGGWLIAGGNGTITGGAYAGLQASAALITETEWDHSQRNTDIGPPRWNGQQLAELLRQFFEYRNVPMFNLEIYQDGTLAPASIALFRQARALLDKPAATR